MRRCHYLLGVAVAALAFLSTHAVRAQEAPSAIQSAAGRIQLDVVAADKSGAPVAGLGQSDFTLLDNGQPAKILSFHAVDGVAEKAHPPVEVIIVIDTVNMPIQQVAFTRQEIEKFLRQNGGHLAQPVSIFVLTNQGLDVQRQSSYDGNALATNVEGLDNRLRTVTSAAGIYGEIERFGFSIKALTSIANAEAKKPGRKLLIWTGSGWPLLNSHTIDSTEANHQQYFGAIVELSTKLREGHTTLDSISEGMMGRGTFVYQDFLKGISVPDKANPPNLALRVLSVQSGGRVMGPDNDLAAQITNCVKDASAFYTISFDPPQASRANEYHELKVQTDKPGLKARTNTGYYNQP